MIDLILRPAAAAEASEAYSWYEEQRQGLGEEFLVELAQTLELIAATPKAFPVIRRETRRALVRRFPFQVLYRLYPEAVVIVSVFHGSRDPRVWRKRQDG